MEGMRLETQIWTCDPLLIVSANGIVRYAAKTDIEFSPDDQTEQTGEAKVLTPKEGWHPTMRIAAREDFGSINSLPSGFFGGPNQGFRGGRTLKAVDLEGVDFTWYINGAADRFLVGES